MRRHLTSRFTARVTAPTEAAVSIAVASSVRREDERLSVTLSGAPVPVLEVSGGDAARLHLLRDLGPGELEVSYEVSVLSGGAPEPFTPWDRIRWVRPSRYADLDRLEAVAGSLFGGLTGRPLVDAVVEHVRTSTAYVPGVSKVTDGASDTFLARAGVCRDFGHLTIALLRARGVPARMVSAYAPGLSPMDFHAVVEVHVDGDWEVVDATGLAPRQSLVRIGTGADAADTAFLTTHTGGLDFGTLQVTATVDGDLPLDDGTQPVRIA